MAQCSKLVKNRLMSGTHQCRKTATVKRNGRPFCAAHDPVAVKEKNDAKEADYQARDTGDPKDKRIAALERKLADAQAENDLCPFKPEREALRVENAELKRKLASLDWSRKPKRPVIYEREGGDVMDRECIPICDALNLLPGIETISSCCGHGYAPFRIYFTAELLADLKPILELIDESEFWSLRTSMATGNMEIYFVLDGLKYDSIFMEADKLAQAIREVATK